MNSKFQDGKLLRQYYQQTFSGEAAKVVLSHMLYELSYFSPCDTPEDQALNNYAKRLLGHIGLLVEGNEIEFVQSLEREMNG